MTEFRTLCDIPRQLQAEYRKSDQLLHKNGGEWRAIPTDDFCGRIRHAALGLARLGISRGDRVALLSENRPEWTAADYAILSTGASVVPIYPTLLPEQIEHLLRDSGAAGIVVSNTAHLDAVRTLRGRLPALRLCVVMDPPAALPEGVLSWTDLLNAGAEEAARRPEAFDAMVHAVQPEDLASIIYTSGTTGVPKGVMLTHANMVHNVTACCAAVPFVSSDVCLSFLPLSHVYERMVEYCYLYRGATIAYAESLDTVARDLQELEPTIACAVPRIFEKIYRRILDAGAALPLLRRPVFYWALAVARRCGVVSRPGRRIRGHLRLQQALADRLVYRALRARLGGRLRFFVSGSAPLSREIAEVFLGMGVIILEGYGLTETSPVIAVNRIEAICPGTVGRPVDGVEVRIDESGEILTKSPSVMKGYYNNEEATREAIVDGWFRTGDIGHLEEHGCLVITDRKKEILKTSGGKMVAPQHLENLLLTDRFIAQAMVVGDRRRFIAALIVPNFEMMRSYAALKGIEYAGIEDLLRHTRIVDLIRRRIARVNDRLARYERIKAFRIIEREFRPETGEITLTLKIRRKVVEERYRDRIEAMYAEAGPPDSETAAPGTGG
jgi:long-chain acyl-CoA synthetase